MTDANQGTGTGAAGGQAMDAFVQISALLTGFAADAIAPSLDPVNLKATARPSTSCSPSTASSPAASRCPG